MIIFAAVIIFNLLYRNSLTKSNKDKLIGEWTGLGYMYNFTLDGHYTGGWQDLDDESDYTYYS